MNILIGIFQLAKMLDTTEAMTQRSANHHLHGWFELCTRQLATVIVVTMIIVDVITNLHCSHY